MVVHIAEVVCISKEEIGHGHAGKAWLAYSAEVERSAGDIGLGRIVVAHFKLNAEVVEVAASHQGQTWRQVVLRVAVLNEALPLGAHDVVSETGDTRCGRCPHDGWDRRIVAGRPADRCEIEVRVFGRAEVNKTTDACVGVKDGHGTDAVIVSFYISLI